MSIDSLLNDMVIEHSPGESIPRFDSRASEIRDAVNASCRQPHLLASTSKPRLEGKRTRKTAKKVNSSRQNHTSDFWPKQAPGRRLASRRMPHAAVRRPPRPKYTEEQIIFIWYMRTDMRLSWDKVLDSYRRCFSVSRDKSGLQCRFYRVLIDWGVEKVRDQNPHPRDGNKDQMIGQYGVVQRTNKRYWWMKLEHRRTPCLDKFR